MRTEQVPCGDAGSMSLFVWEPPAGERPRGSVLIIQEIFGVGPFIQATAERYAAAGYVVGAPDVFWRFAPNFASDHTESGMATSMQMVQQLDFPLAVQDCVAALGRLGEVAGATASGKAPAVMGYCLGGTLAWAVAAAGDPSCCVSYYGSGVPSMLGMIDQVSCPTLFHFGNADAFIPNEGVDAVGAAIAGRDGFVLNVENAGHAFENHEAEMFWNESAAKSSTAKTLAFLAEHA
ncbi:MAG: dienelactone hydrolase family protein [Acidimicrobiales bacterium]